MRVGRGYSQVETPPEEQERVVGLYVAEEQSIEAIHRETGVHQETIRKILRRRGIELKRRFATGQDHGLWKGGRRVDKKTGYVWIRLPLDDPLFEMRNGSGYVQEHRYVMAQLLGRPLEPHETVHHINDDKTDNSPENLQLRHGKHGKEIVLVCRCCGSSDVEAVDL